MHAVPSAEKVLGPRLVEDSAFQRAYPVEVGLLAALDVAQLAAPERYIVDEGGRVVASVQRTVDGPVLTGLLEHRPRGLGVETTALVALDLLTGLAAMHKLGAAHRNCRADHVALTPAGLCVLLDPGLAERREGEALETAFAADLVGLAEIIGFCLGRRPETAPPFLARLLECRTDPESARRKSATALLTDLGAAAEIAFAGDWTARARERLAAAVSQGLAIEAENAGCAPQPGSRRRAARPRPVGRFAAVVLAAAVVGIVTQRVVARDAPSGSPHQDGAGPTTSQQVGAVGTTSATASQVPSSRASSISTTLAPPPAPSAPDTTAPARAAASPTPSIPSATTVTQLSIASFAYDGEEPTQAQTVVTVRTSGTGPITVILTFSGSNTAGQAGSNAPFSDHFALSGKTSYTVTDTTYGAQFCYTPYWSVTATSTPAAPASAFAQLASPSCT